MPDQPPPILTFRIKALRRDRSLAPGGGRFGELAEAFLPLVYGGARMLVPESTDSAEKISTAAFESFGWWWRNLRRKTLIAPWLLRTVFFAAARERKRLGLGSAKKGSDPWQNREALKALSRLAPKYLDAVLVQTVLGFPSDVSARALSISETRLAKRTDCGLRKFGKALRRRKIGEDPSEFLRRISSVPTEENQERILATLSQWSRKEKKGDLVRRTLWSWEWAGVRRRLARVGRVLCTVLCVLACLAGTAAWMGKHGYLMAFFIKFGSRGIARDFPELKAPATPWPKSEADKALVQSNFPKTSAELFAMTNIWLCKLSFTPEQWSKITPSRIPPVPNMFENGRITLRNPKARRSGLAGAVGIDFNWTEGKMEFAGRELSDVAVRFRGNGTYLTSLYGPKQSLKVDLDKFTKKQQIGGVHTLNFVNMVPDFSSMHDALAEQLFRDMGVVAPRTAYSYVTVDVPGKFTNQALGLYIVIENIDGDFAANRFGNKKAPIFKPVTYDLFTDLGDDWNGYEAVYDLKTKATPEQLRRVIDLAKLVSHGSDAEFVRRLPDFLDIEEFAAFVAGHVLLASYDGFLTNGQNYYVYLDPRSNKFGFISWDQDHAWGDFGHIGKAAMREHASIWNPSVYRNLFLERVMTVGAFRDAYRGKLEHALANEFRPERLAEQIDKLAAIIRPAVAAESAFRLKRFDQAISTNWVAGPRDGEPEGPRAPVHQIKRFVQNRIKSVRNQLDGKSAGISLSAASME